MAYKKVEASFYRVVLGMQTLCLGRETGNPKEIAGFVLKFDYPQFIILPLNIGQVTNDAVEVVKWQWLTICCTMTAMKFHGQGGLSCCR